MNKTVLPIPNFFEHRASLWSCSKRFCLEGNGHGRMPMPENTAMVMTHFAVCRNKFLRLLSSQPKAPMVLQESSEVLIRIDDQDTPVQLQQLRMKQGQETVGLKLQVEE